MFQKRKAPVTRLRHVLVSDWRTGHRKSVAPHRPHANEETLLLQLIGDTFNSARSTFQRTGLNEPRKREADAR
jgi:hypothetical protein